MTKYICSHMLKVCLLHGKPLISVILIVILRQRSLFILCSKDISVAVHFSALLSKKTCIGFLKECEEAWTQGTWRETLILDSGSQAEWFSRAQKSSDDSGSTQIYTIATIRLDSAAWMHSPLCGTLPKYNKVK